MADVDPRSTGRSSTFLGDSRMRTYIITSRITSGDELKRWDGDGGSARDLRPMSDCYQVTGSHATFV